jgi:HEAT repeat protein
MSRKTAISWLGILVAVVLGALVAFKSEKAASIFGDLLGPSDPPLVRPEKIVYENWLAEWQSRLPVAGTLKESEISQFFNFSSSSHREYTLHVELQNQTNYHVETGHNLYLIETARPAAPDSEEELLEVAGGYFTEDPLEDYSGVGEFRGLEESEYDLCGLHNSHVVSPKGEVVRRLGPLIVFTIGRYTERVVPSFGHAQPGDTLTIDSTLQLAVMVKKELQEKATLVSPALIFQNEKGERAAFRYLISFTPTFADTEKVKRQWQFSAAELLPLISEALLPRLAKPSLPLWQRVLTAHWAGEYGKEQAGESLMAIAGAKGQESDVLRAAAIRGLGSAKQTSAVPQLISILKNKSENFRTRDAAIQALGRIGDPVATPLLLDIVKRNIKAETREAILALGELGDLAAVEPLIGILENNNRSEYHDEAGRALGKLADNSHLERLAKIARNTRYQGNSHAITAIGGIGTPEAGAILIELAQSNSETIRSGACAALGKIDTPEALATLKTALNDKELSVREAAVEGLAELDNENRRAALIEALRSPHVDVQQSAMELLAALRVAAAKPGIVALLNDGSEDTEVRESAAKSLSYYPGKESAEILTGALTDSSAAVRIAAISALQDLKAKNTLPNLLQVLKDQKADVRSAAAEAIGKIGEGSAISPLVESLLKETESSVLHSLVNALIDLNYKDFAAFSEILARLKNLNSEERAPLERLLTHLSSEDFGAGWSASSQEVEESIKKWQDWLDKSAAEKAEAKK